MVGARREGGSHLGEVARDQITESALLTTMGNFYFILRFMSSH